MKRIDLKELGLNERFKGEASFYGEELFLGRVSVQNRDIYRVITEKGEVRAEVSGKFKYETYGIEDFPAVGDWVLLDREEDLNGNAIIHRLLKRKSYFQRKVAGQRSDGQVVAANIDTVFICMSLNNDFNMRRLERYVSVAWDSMSTPVVILTKADLCENIQEKKRQVSKIAVGMEIIVTSSFLNEGFESLKNYLGPGKTVAFIGSSGVGKSTMINTLLESDELKTAEIGNNDKGRHTTTYRQLFLIKSGGVLIDTPGIRELGMVSGDIERGFSDIEELASRCKFSDCRHINEPHCAVREAINHGHLDEKRLESYKKLQRELIYSDLKSAQVEKEKIISMFGSMAEMKKATRHIKGKNKKRMK